MPTLFDRRPAPDPIVAEQASPIRAINFTVIPAAGNVDVWAHVTDDFGHTIPVYWKPDPNNQSRGQLFFPLVLDGGVHEITGVNIRIRSNGFKEFSNRDILPGVGAGVESQQPIELEPSAIPFPPGTSRAPLPPFDVPGPDGAPVFTVLPDRSVWGDPPRLNPIIKRANLYGFTVPGAPDCGDGSRNPTRILSWSLPRFSADWQDRILTAYAAPGYTHFMLSYQDAVNGFGLTDDQFLTLCQKVKRFVPFLEIRLASKLWLQDITLPVFAATFEGIIDRLTAAGVVDFLCPAWEMNLPFNATAGDAGVYPVIGWLASKCEAAGIRQCLHFTSYVNHWGNPGQDEDDFWNELTRGNAFGGPNQVAAVNWQANEFDNIGQKTAHLQDVQNCFERTGTNAVIWADEVDSENIFQNDLPDEDHGDLHGFELACSPNRSALVCGFGNGARMPDGSVL